MRPIIRLAYLMLLATGGSAKAAYPEHLNVCSSLLIPDKTVVERSEVTRLALITMVTQNSSSNADVQSKFGGLIGPVLFSGDLAAARSEQHRLEKKLNFVINKDEIESYIHESLPKYISNDFVRCIEGIASKSGLHLSIDNTDEESFGIRAAIKSPEGNNSPLKLRVNANADLLSGRSAELGASGLTRSLQFKRINPARPSRVQFEVLRDGIPIFSDYVVVAPFVSTKVNIRSRSITGPQASASCGGNRVPMVAVHGPQHVMRPEAGGVFRPDSARTEVNDWHSTSTSFSPLPPSGISIDEKTSDVIVYHAMCNPNNTHHFYRVGGVVNVLEEFRDVVVRHQIDTGEIAQSRVVIE